MKANCEYSIPAHLPKKLAMSFWLWGHFLGAQEGDFFHDLERRFVELKERGFNTIRVDAGIGLCFTTDGKRRGPIDLVQPFGEPSSHIRQMNLKGGRCDVLDRLVLLLQFAKKYDVYVILSSWLYLHTFWFVDQAIRREVFAVPPAERFMYLAREHDMVLNILKEQGLHTQIAFVEISNECDGPLRWGWYERPGRTGTDEQAGQEVRQFHEDAISFLRARHPDLLFACDTMMPTCPEVLLPRNMQLWNSHMYYAWGVYGKAFEDDVQKPGFDFEDPFTHPVLRRFLRKPPVPLAEIKNSAGNAPIAEGWYRRVWLYSNIDPAAVEAADECLAKTFVENVDGYKRYAGELIDRAVAVRDASFPGMPLVVGEAATYCGGECLRWEEESDEYWAMIEHVADRLKAAGFWGYMPRTNCGPEDPVWSEFPDRLRRVNSLFLAD